MINSSNINFSIDKALVPKTFRGSTAGGCLNFRTQLFGGSSRMLICRVHRPQVRWRYSKKVIAHFSLHSCILMRSSSRMRAHVSHVAYFRNTGTQLDPAPISDSPLQRWLPVSTNLTVNILALQYGIEQPKPRVCAWFNVLGWHTHNAPLCTFLLAFFKNVKCLSFGEKMAR